MSRILLLAAGFYGVLAVAAGGMVFRVMAAGIGVAIGLAMQFLGRGIDSKFPVAASVLAVLGCLLGKYFAIVMLTAKGQRMSPFDIFSSVPPGEVLSQIYKSLGVADLVFWMLAIAAASYFAKRRLTHEEGLALHVYENRRPGMITE